MSAFAIAAAIFWGAPAVIIVILGAPCLFSKRYRQALRSELIN